MTVEVDVKQKIKEVFKKVLDINPEDIKPSGRLDQSLGIDSTEMVEISVCLKKELGVVLADNEIKKTHTLNDIVTILQSKLKADQGCGGGQACGCRG